LDNAHYTLVLASISLLPVIEKISHRAAPFYPQSHDCRLQIASSPRRLQVASVPPNHAATFKSRRLLQVTSPPPNHAATLTNRGAASNSSSCHRFLQGRGVQYKSNVAVELFQGHHGQLALATKELANGSKQPPANN
jgi:hypothetical protein